MYYFACVFQVRQSDHFVNWLEGLADSRGKKKIAQRLIRLQAGLLGDAKFFDGIGELRIDSGPGYRLYFVRVRMSFSYFCAAETSHRKPETSGRPGRWRRSFDHAA
jgi:putative addiction module killer protein